MDAVPITVYSRERCHLCEEAIETIERVSDETAVPVEIDEVDVDGEPALREAYGERVPYVLIDGRPAFKYRVDEAALRARLTDRE
ncbi:glutaredoxin family protein [Haloferacaceae archaeon DSL9]